MVLRVMTCSHWLWRRAAVLPNAGKLVAVKVVMSVSELRPPPTHRHEVSAEESWNWPSAPGSKRRDGTGSSDRRASRMAAPLQPGGLAAGLLGGGRVVCRPAHGAARGDVVGGSESRGRDPSERAAPWLHAADCLQLPILLSPTLSYRSPMHSSPLRQHTSIPPSFPTLLSSAPSLLLLLRLV